MSIIKELPDAVHVPGTWTYQEMALEFINRGKINEKGQPMIGRKVLEEVLIDPRFPPAYSPQLEKFLEFFVEVEKKCGKFNPDE